MLDDWPEFLRRVERLKQHVERAKGVLSEKKKVLREVCGTTKLAVARRRRDRAKEDELSASEKYVRARKKFDKEFEERWAGLLEEFDET